MKTFFSFLFSAYLITSTFSQQTVPENSTKNGGYCYASYRKVCSVHVTVNLGICQASGTITYTTNNLTGEVHAYYSLATNCGGSISGTAGTIFKTTDNREGDVYVVDLEYITSIYSSESVKKDFESNNGKLQMDNLLNRTVNGK